LYSPAQRIGRRRSAKSKASESTDAPTVYLSGPALESRRLSTAANFGSLGENPSRDVTTLGDQLPHQFLNLHFSGPSKYKSPYITAPPSSTDHSEWSSASKAQSPANHHSRSSQSDCTTIAVDTLLQLELAQIKLKQRQSLSLDLEAPIKTVTTASKTLSAVLVCPCSESPDVALLAAAVCLSMLAVYSTITEDQSTQKLGHPLDNDMSIADGCMLMLSVEDAMTWDSTSNDKSALSLSDDSKEDIGVRVLGELAKVARVVSQFRNRYQEESAGDNSPDFLRGLASLLRSKVQSVTAQMSN
jgi:Aflatoxin regulatory protein